MFNLEDRKEWASSSSSEVVILIIGKVRHYCAVMIILVSLEKVQSGHHWRRIILGSRE